MNHKKLFLTMSLMTLTPASQALNDKPIKTFLERVKTNKIVQYSSEGVQIVCLATLTALLMGSASQNMGWATESLKAGKPKDIQDFIKLCSSESLLKGMAVIVLYATTKTAQKARAPQSGLQEQNKEASEQAA